jgi:diazepam-binding inhibitor (GABA receptor modulator, acyl-CoA-binding protein)
MTTLQEQFDFAVEQVRALPSSGNGPSDKEKLKMYGLYKQVTVGDCDTAQPWAVQVEARAKWDAWNANKGTSKTNAMSAYCDAFLSMNDKYST